MDQISRRTELHKAHAEQAMGRFLRLGRLCFEERGLFAFDRHLIELGMHTFLKCLVRRVEPGAAANLIAQLPSLLRDSLYEAPAGPQCSIDLAVLERAVRRSMCLSDAQVTPAVQALAETLVFSVSPGEIHAFCAQLPKDLRGIFEGIWEEERLRRA